MPDVRRSHITYPPGPSLMNQETRKFISGAHSLYGPTGPVQQAHTGRQEGPQSLEEMITEAVGRVAGLSARQRNGVCSEMVRLTRDLHFIRQVTEEAKAKGPWSAEAAQPTAYDQGRPL